MPLSAKLQARDVKWIVRAYPRWVVGSADVVDISLTGLPWKNELDGDTADALPKSRLPLGTTAVLVGGRPPAWIHICVSTGYTYSMKKQDAGLRLRVERALREEFIGACRAEGIPAAQVLRTFMRQYVHEKTAQQDLFSQPSTGTRQGR